MPDRNSTFAAALCGALARLGVEHACITPGSRSTPLALALADEPGVTDWSHHDERSSAFFALGIARTTRSPVIVVTTSGTAAAELYPAVVEARYGRVPLLVITADRPAELRDSGAPQTIDQRDLFGRMTMWSHAMDVGDHDPTRWLGALAARMVTAALGPPSGPVHLNLGFREPLVPTAPIAAPVVSVPDVVRPDSPVDPGGLGSLVATISGRRGVLVAGAQDSPYAVEAAARFATAARWPILADPLSGLRAGRHDTTAVIGHGDAIASEGWLDRAPPDVVVRFGAVPTSKPLWRWLGDHPATPQVLVEPHGWRDPTATASSVVRAEPSPVLDALADEMAPADDGWLEAWVAADAAAAAAIDTALAKVAFPSEPAVARMLGSALPDPSTLWVASSMPIRDVDAFFGVTAKRVRILGNRGANGIDGFLSAGLGSAATSEAPTVLLAGDLSVLHDVGALATAARLGIRATIVAVNNDGGGIFHFLPQDGHRHFERHFGTPHGLSLSAVALAFGVAAHEVTDPDDLAKAVGEAPPGPRLLEIRTDRRENLAVHRSIGAAVRTAIETL